MGVVQRITPSGTESIDAPMAMLTRELDPSRLILDESGVGHLVPICIYPTKKNDQINDIHNYAGAYINEKIYNSYVSMAMTEEEKRPRAWGNLKRRANQK